MERNVAVKMVACRKPELRVAAGFAVIKGERTVEISFGYFDESTKYFLGEDYLYDGATEVLVREAWSTGAYNLDRQSIEVLRKNAVYAERCLPVSYDPAERPKWGVDYVVMTLEAFEKSIYADLFIEDKLTEDGRVFSRHYRKMRYTQLERAEIEQYGHRLSREAQRKMRMARFKTA